MNVKGLTAALVGFCLAGSALSSDWPQYQGPDRDSTSKEQGILKVWPGDGPKILWRIPFFEGYSGLSVVGGRIYTQYGRDGDEFTVCLDAADGHEIWRVRTDRNRSDGQGGGPRSTPTVAEGIVYSVSARNVLHALRAEDGEVVWRIDLKARFGGDVPTWGVSGSPLIDGRMLVVEAGGKPGQSLISLDKTNGEVIWTSHTDKLAYSSPGIEDIRGVRQILFATASGVVGVEASGGRPLWSFPWATKYDVNAASPILVGADKIFYSSSYGKGAVLFRILRRAGKFSTEEIWRSRVMKNHFHSSILYGDHLYGFDNGTLKCIVAQSGEELWKARGYQKGAMMLADGHLIVLGERGKLGLVEATPEGFNEVASAQILKGKCWTNPALSDGRLYLRNQTEMLALNFKE